MVFVTSYYFDGDYGKIPIWPPPPEGYSGIWTNWHENGIRAFKGSYDRGMRQGSWRFWFPNGQIQLEGTYKGGLSNGKWTWWHANGLRSVEANYQNGRPHGKRTEWDKNGKIIDGTHFADGKITFLERYEEGKLVSTEPAPTYEEHASKVADKVSVINTGMTRKAVEAILNQHDGGLTTSSVGRYYEGWEVMVEVPYDQTGDPGAAENRVNGGVRIYRARPSFD